MRTLTTAIIALLFLFTSAKSTEEKRIEPRSIAMYHEIDFGTNLPDQNTFTNAISGYEKLKNEGKIKSEILTIIDFNLSANKERMWVIDMKNQSLLIHTLVAHGRNSGNEFAQNFSNESGSYKSSLGFYLTAYTYDGKHGNSLKLIGIEKGINDNAFDRGIVIHGADYVSKSFIQQNGRLGRSLGCPAVPEDVNDNLVNTIKGGSCLFIYKNDQNYLNSTRYIN